MNPPLSKSELTIVVIMRVIGVSGLFAIARNCRSAFSQSSHRRV